MLAVALLANATSLGAQVSRLEGRASATLRTEVERLADSVRGAGLPTEPLIAKTLEGTAKGASDERILAAVRALSTRLAAAREALGARSSVDELVSGAEALRAGTPATALDRVRKARGESSVTVPLTVLADLVSRGVPADTAAAVVVGLAERKASDTEFDNLRRNVERDIGHGVPPAAAASFRGRGGPPANVPGRGGVPPGQANKPPKNQPNPPRGRP